MSRFVRNAIVYSGASLVSQSVKVAQEFLVRRLLLPSQLGIWSLATVTQGFAATFDMGIGTAMERELPLLVGAKKHEEVSAVRSTGFTSKLLQNGAIAIVITIYALLFRHHDRKVLAATIAGALMMLSLAVFESMSLFHQTAQRFGTLSRTLVTSAVLSACLVTLGAWAGGTYGLLVGGVTGVGLQAVLLTLSARAQGMSFRTAVDRSIFKRLISYGLPFRVVDYPLSLFCVIDGLFVAHYLGVEALAIYTTAKVILIQAADMPGKVANVLIMRLFNRAGASQGRAEFGTDLMRFLVITHLVLIPGLILGITIITSFVFVRFLPQYARALPVLHTLLFALFFMPQTSVVRSVWMLDRRLGAIGLANLFSFTGLVIAGQVTFHLKGVSIYSVALAMVAGYACFFAIHMATIGRTLWGWRGALQLCCLVALSLGGTVFVLRGLTEQPTDLALLPGLSVLAMNALKAAALIVPLGALAAWKARLFGARTAPVAEQMTHG